MGQMIRKLGLGYKSFGNCLNIYNFSKNLKKVLGICTCLACHVVS